ncbi:MFS transporter [Olivibacter sp. XZL3]|uniref:MFS transporter n=1 Tax=Olivibacter sp. XZL3 TaxID=1735116 RepID=UPI001416FBB1|nr:MFS transporter [Olivibacter sp. XZL3]
MNKEPKKYVFNNQNIAVGIVFFLLGLSFTTWTSRVADIQQKLNLTDGQLGSVLFAMPVGLWISLAVSGWFVRKYSSKSVAVWGLVLYHIILVAIGLSNTTIQLAVSLFLSGLFYSAVNVSMNTQGTLAEQKINKPLLPFFHGIWSVAGFIGASVGTLLIKSGISTVAQFTIIASLGITAILISKRHLFYKPEIERVGKAFAIPEKSLIILGVIAFFAMICESAMYDWSVVYFQKEVYNANDNIGIGYSIFMAMMTVGRFANNFLLGKYGIRNLILINACLIFSGTLSAIIYPSLTVSCIGFGLVGLGISSMVPLIAGVASKTKRMAPASGIASVLTIGFIGFLFSPPLIGILSEYFNLRMAFVLLVVSSLFIGGLSRFLKP